MTTVTRSGLIVPFGVPGTTSVGRLTIARGAVTWPEDVTWVKLLLEHDQAGPVLGHAVELWETDTGLRGTFELREGVDLGGRDGLSAGIDFDDATKVRVKRASNASVAGAGHLREVSLASVPAFEPARLDPA